MKSRRKLERAQGYRVHTRDGRIGRVALVLPRAGRDESGVLLVHTGERSCELSPIPFDEVEAIDVGARRVVLREPPAPVRRPRRAPRSSRSLRRS
ncbi:MAG TPA: hypothetical protein VFU26_03900 [Gaiellaceae bacterium]|nr:hypothetical protein [Gaiellaceae bacterium]